MFFHKKTLMGLVVTFFAFALFGCGEKTVVTADNKLEASQNCISCHQNDNWVSPGSGKLIVDEWKQSVHNTANTAGCADCHEPHAGHPNTGDCNRCHGGAPVTGSDVTVNPDKDGKCAKCHKKGSSWGTSVYDGVSADIQFLHYSTGTRANFVATNYIGNCRKCHNPHDPTTAKDKLQQWSRSGHGNTLSLARTQIDFKSRGSFVAAKDNFGSFCVRCHTSTGYISYVASGFSDVRALPDTDGVRGRTTYLDKSRELTSCNACHDDGRPNDGSAYSYKVRAVPAVTTYYNYSSAPLHNRAWDVKKTVKYSDFGASNVCVSCHAGREIGSVIRLASALGMDFSNQSRINAHFKTAASTMSAISGFHFYSSATQYQNPPYFEHDKIGTADTDPPNAGGSNGPCIGCHLKNNRSHYYQPVSVSNGIITEVLSDAQVCSNCHNSANPNSAQWKPDTLQARKDGLKAALMALQQMMLRPNKDSTKALGTFDAQNAGTYNDKTIWTKPFGNVIVPASGNPTDNNATNKITAGAYTMGAAFNYEMLLADAGAYAHNSHYVRRLIYDSVDWLYDGTMNQNIKAALDYLKSNKFITSGTKTSTYEMALAYLCGSKNDPTGSAGVRP